MLKKLLTLTIALFCINIHPFLAEESYDLSLLRKLFLECELRGIRTDYEKINYEVIRRFENYLALDEINSVSDEQLAYNRLQIIELYNEARTNMEAYLDGTKKPVVVSDYDINSMESSGRKLISDKGKSIYSIGYTGWGQVMEDIGYFRELGADNVVLEIGPTSVTAGLSGWEISNIDLSTGIVSDGKRSLKYTASSGSVGCISQIVECEPDTVYEYSVESRGNSDTVFEISMNDSVNTASVKSTWSENKFYYTTGINQTYIMVKMSVYGTTGTLYIDNVCLKKSGNDENLFVNGSFEDDTDFAAMPTWRRILYEAKQNNTGVSLLLSPHYFPSGLSSEIYSDNPKGGYNIDSAEARMVIENYLRTVLPCFQNAPELTSIILSNEPMYDTHAFPEFYNPKYREYLKQVHGNISTLNSKYGTNYSSFDEISMPEIKVQTVWSPEMYDWIQFNDKTFADWHKWMAGIVKEYLPDIPVHAKVLEYIFPWNDDDGRESLARGTDLEMFSGFCDWWGFDACDYTYNTDMYYMVMMLYDYLDSIEEKPIYNSEDHIIPDRYEEFSDLQRKHLRNNLWQGAIHGRDMSTLWVWERSYDENSDLYNSILHRPDCVAEAGKTKLDLNRLSDFITRINEKSPEVALFYSKPSRVYDPGARGSLRRAYKALMNCGQKVGFVSDYSIDKLEKYKVLVIPSAQYCKADTLAAVENFVKNGGRVFMCSDSFQKDEYTNALSNSYLLRNATVYSRYDDRASETYVFEQLRAFLENQGMMNVKVCDQNGDIPVGIEWEYVGNKDNMMINITSILSDITDLHVEVDGKVLSGGLNHLTNEVAEDIFDVGRYTPVLFEYGATINDKTENVYPGIENLKSDNGTVSWTYTEDENYGVSIYSIDNNSLNFIGNILGNEYSGIQNETFFLMARSLNGTTKKGEVISVFNTKPVKIEFLNVKKVGHNLSFELLLNNTVSTPVKTTVSISDEEQNKMLIDIYLKGNSCDRISINTQTQSNEITAVALDILTSKNALSDTAKYIINE